MTPAEETRWMTAGACRDADTGLFFPPDGNADAAKQVCRGCPVRLDCLDYALRHGITYGTWGGESEEDRRLIRRRRARYARSNAA